jgi:WD40 repeat protein
VEGTWPPGGVMRLWDTNDETAIRDHGGAFVRFSPVGGVIASAGGGANRYVNLHDTATGADLGDLDNGPGYITSLEFSPDGALLAVGCTDNTIKLWDVATLALVDELDGFIEDVAAVAFSRDGALVAGAEGGFDVDQDAWIRVFRVSDGLEVGAWQAHGDAAYDLAFGPAGEILASSGREGTAPLVQSIRYWNLADGALLREYAEQAVSLAIAGDGARIAYGRGDGSVVVAAEDIFADLTAAPVPTAAAAVLHPARPNPFNPLTEIRFELAVAQRARLAIHDAAGRRVALLADGHRAAGAHRLRWNGLDQRGRAMPSGVYLVRLETGAGIEVRKISLVR